MELLWNGFVDLLQALLFLISHGYGGELGPAILTLSLGIRLLLLPLTYRAAVRSIKNRQLLRQLRPRVEQLRAKHKDNPARAAEATLALNREHGISPFDRSTLSGVLVQGAFAGGMLATLRRVLYPGSGGFLWVKDLSEPSLVLAGLAAGALGLAGAIGSAGGGSEHTLAPLILMPVVTLLVVARMSSGFALHLLASSTVGVLQAVVVRRRHGEGRS